MEENLPRLTMTAEQASWLRCIKHITDNFGAGHAQNIKTINSSNRKIRKVSRTGNNNKTITGQVITITLGLIEGYEVELIIEEFSDLSQQDRIRYYAYDNKNNMCFIYNPFNNQTNL